MNKYYVLVKWIDGLIYFYMGFSADGKEHLGRHLSQAAFFMDIMTAKGVLGNLKTDFEIYPVELKLELGKDKAKD